MTDDSPRIIQSSRIFERPVATAPLTSTGGAGATSAGTTRETVFSSRDVNVYYGSFCAVRDVTFDVHKNEIMALIGPSGCGKSTVLRCYNRMNDLIKGARVTGSITYRGTDLYDERVDPVEVRRRIGMVFQKPNPFPKSVYDNVAYGPRVAGQKRGLDDIVERSLRKAALWDEVRDRLKDSAFPSPEASSSACASLVRSRSTPTCY